NVATPRYPSDDPRIKPFFDGVPAINALAERTPGFVWRLSDPDEEAKAADVFGEPGLIIALSVWQDMASLREFVYRSDHLSYLRQRTQWFQPRMRANKALWWIDAGVRPSILEARHRLDYLTQHGASDIAFGFNDAFQKEVTT
ncbi:MAG: DUF3291 domain-containing protein, partial [Pseudomonadota bacterium]